MALQFMNTLLYGSRYKQNVPNSINSIRVSASLLDLLALLVALVLCTVLVLCIWDL